MKLPITEFGNIRIVPLLVIITIVGVISFLLVTSTLPFTGQFSTIFPKPPSQAASNQIYWGGYLDGPDTYGPGFKQGGMDCNAAATVCPTWDLFQSHAQKNTSLISIGIGQCWGLSTCQQFNAILNPLNAIVARGNVAVVGVGTFNLKDSDVADGNYDTFIKTWAQQAKAWDHPFFMRFDWEMNGCWFSWGPTGPASCKHPAATASNAADYIRMWKHVHDVFVANGANNVTWIWCPNNESNAQANNPTDPNSWVANAADFYPSGQDAQGHDYVDWTCFDAYNTAGLPGGSGVWQPWDQTAGPIYNHLLRIAPTKPILVGETSSTELGAPAGQSKATWITDFLAQLPAHYTQIKAISWFNWKITESGVTKDYPIESSTASQNAFAAGIANTYYASNIFTSPPVDSNGKILPPGPFSSPTPAPTPVPVPTNSFVKTVNTNGQLRNDFSDYAGMKFTVGSTAITITSLGRYFVPGNSGTHTLEIIRDSDKTILASTQINMATGVQDTLGFKYVTLTPAIQLAANSSYYIASQETSGGDQWYGNSTLPSLTTTNIATINSGIYHNPSTSLWTVQSAGTNSYIPLNFLTQVVATPTPSPTPSPTPTPTLIPTPIPTPNPTPNPLPGDISGQDGVPDGVVDIFDYNVIVSNFKKHGTNIPGDISGQDGVPDGVVDIFDFNVIATNFGKRV